MYLTKSDNQKFHRIETLVSIRWKDVFKAMKQKFHHTETRFINTKIASIMLLIILAIELI